MLAYQTLSRPWSRRDQSGPRGRSHVVFRRGKSDRGEGIPVILKCRWSVGIDQTLLTPLWRLEDQRMPGRMPKMGFPSVSNFEDRVNFGAAIDLRFRREHIYAEIPMPIKIVDKPTAQMSASPTTLNHSERIFQGRGRN